MANTRFGNFSELSQGKKPMTAEEAWIMLNQLGLLGQEFIPGATSVRKLMEGEPKEAAEELQDWIPGNAAYQNVIRGNEQDWIRNVLDAMIIGKPALKGAKKVAEVIEKMPKGGKEGFITLTKPTGENKLKDVIEASNAAGQSITPEIEKQIRDHIGLINQMKRSPSRAVQKAIVNHYDRATPEAKQVIDGYLGQEHPHGFKPQGFNSWPADKRIEYYESRIPGSHTKEEVQERARNLKNENYGGHQDYGVIYSDVMTTDDYMKALLDKEAEEKAAAQAPITMTEVQDLSTGILPSENSSVARGGTRNSYDHSRQFMDTELKEVPRIDRSGKSYGEDIDAFYDIYKAWRNSKFRRSEPLSKKLGYDTEGTEALRNLKKEAMSGKNRTKDMFIKTDPYYAAGVVGDENKRLWDRIKALRNQGKSDAEIRELLKNRLNDYQGQIERLKERMPTKGHNSQFKYDGATTQRLRATPSEEVRALKALGIDIPEYDELERLGDFYRVFFPK